MSKKSAKKQIVWRSRVVGHGRKPADQFLFHPKNPKVHPEAQHEALKGGIETIGFIDPVLVSARTGYLIDGHERVWLGMQSNNAEIDFTLIDLEPEEEEFALLTLDPIAGLAQYDLDKTNELFEEIEIQNASIQAMLDSILNATDAPVLDAPLEHDIEDGFDEAQQHSLELSNAMLIFGEYRAEVERAVYLQVIEDIRQEHGFDKNTISKVLLERITGAST